MVIQQKYHTLLKQCLILLVYLFVYIPKASSQAHDFSVSPSIQTICADDIARFSVDTNYPGATYVWYKQSGNVWVNLYENPGYVFYYGEAGTYRCEMIISGATYISKEFKIEVKDIPIIQGFDIPQVCHGDELRVKVSMSENNTDNIINKSNNVTAYEWRLADNQGTETSLSQKGGDGVQPISKIDDFKIPDAYAKQSGMVLTLTLTYSCGETRPPGIITSNPPKPIIVWETPPNPIPVIKDYCLGEKIEIADSLRITSSNDAVWYDAPTGGEKIKKRPIYPKADVLGTQSWWVSQIVNYDGISCESNRQPVTVTIKDLPKKPDTDHEIPLCLNDANITLKAETEEPGTTIRWYDALKNPLPSAPQINTSDTAKLTQIYYVTSDNGACSSPFDDGKVTVVLKLRSNVDAIELKYNTELCPNNKTWLSAETTNPQFGPIFRWYKNENKTELLYTGPVYETPVLTDNTAYYVTLQYEKAKQPECESLYPKAAVINVRDITLPTITAPPHLVIGADDGKCYASNVQTGLPIASDNCTIEENLLIFTDPPAPTIYYVGDTTLVWWAQDEAVPIPNRDYALQTISVRDWEKPRGTCPEDIEWNIDENETSAVVYYSKSYTDNCGIVRDTLVRGFHSGSVFPLGTTLVRHLISDRAGNTDTCQFNVIVKYPYREPRLTLRPNKYEICPNDEVVITPVISGGSGRFTYSWKQPRPWSDAVMRDYPMRNTTYEVTVSDGVSPPMTESVHITVLSSNPVNLTLEGVTMDKIFEGDQVLITASSGFPSYKLLLNHQVIQNTGLNNHVGFQAELGTYVVGVFATDESGCVSQDQMEILVDSKRLPNVFTPNHDGINDRFLEGFDLKVFSRANELLYQGTDGWDGTYKGKPVQQGTYLYVVTRRMNNGEFRVFKGWVTLKL